MPTYDLMTSRTLEAIWGFVVRESRLPDSVTVEPQTARSQGMATDGNVIGLL